MPRAFAEARRDWWSSLGQPPRPLTRPEWGALWIVSALAALSRLVALSKTPWDWDESLFMAAMRKYDVTMHHPHPPGFPLYIGAAKIFALFGFSDFHSLQAVVLIAAMAIVPVIFFLGREARFTPEASLSAAALYAFLPNVWVYGGTAFSDVPATVLVLLAIGLLLAGCRNDLALLSGGLVLGISIAFRPQNLLIGAAAAAIAAAYCLAKRRFWQLGGSVALAILATGASYGIAAYLSNGLPAYVAAVRTHSAYIERIDSFHNPFRTPLLPLFGDIFAHPFRASEINVAIDALMLLGLAMAFVRHRIPSFLLIATFAPFFFAAWLYLDMWGMSRFAVAYMPLFTFLAVDGLSFVNAPIRRSIVVIIILVAVVWTWPVLRELHRHASPPAEAATWLRAHENSSNTIWTHVSVLPLMEEFLPGLHIVSTGDGGPPITYRPGDVYVREGILENGIVFSRRRRRIEGIVRNRYFDVTVVPIERYITYGEGWFGQEHAGASTWRWMGDHGRLLLPPLGRPGILTLDLHIPLDALPAPPSIEARINGMTIDRFVPNSANVRRTYAVAPADTITRVELTTTEVIKPPGDRRLLGIRLNALDWSARDR